MRNAVPYDKRLLLVDIEGTLADDGHRLHFRGTDWDSFYSEAQDDGVFFVVRDILNFLKETHHIIGITNRPAEFRTPLLNWLGDKVPGVVEDVLMKESGMSGDEGEVKLAILEDHFGSQEEVLANINLALEDREKTVETFRSYGLTVWQVR